MAFYDVVAGTTVPLQFQLLEDNFPIDITDATVELLLSDREGETVANPGTVSVVDGPLGIVQLIPTDNAVFEPDRGPYHVRWKLTGISGQVAFVPSSIRDIWYIISQ